MKHRSICRPPGARQALLTLAAVAAFSSLFLFAVCSPTDAALRGPDYEAARAMMQQAKDEANGLVAAGNFEEAAAKFQEVRAAYPNETEVCAASLHYEGMMWSRQAHDPRGALEPFWKLLDDYPQILSAETRVEMANNCYFPLGEYDKGLAVLVEMVIHGPAYDGCGVYRGGPFQVWADERLLEYLKFTAWSLAAQGRPHDLAHVARSPLGENCSTYVLRLVIRQMLENVQGLGVARTPEEDERYEYVNARFEKWLSWAPGEKLADRPRQQLAWDLADLNLVYGNSKRAAELYAGVYSEVASDPDYPRFSDLILRIARASYDGFGLEDAVSRLRAIAEEHPATEASTSALAFLSETLIRAGDYPRAQQLFESEPFSPYAGTEAAIRAFKLLVRVGQDFVNAADYPRARQVFEIGLHMDLPAEYRAQADGWTAQTYIREKNYDTAVEALNGMVGRYAGTPAAVAAEYHIGECRRWQGRYGEARHAYEKVIETAPGTSQAEAAQQRIEELPKQEGADPRLFCPDEAFGLVGGE